MVRSKTTQETFDEVLDSFNHEISRLMKQNSHLFHLVFVEDDINGYSIRTIPRAFMENEEILKIKETGLLKKILRQKLESFLSGVENIIDLWRPISEIPQSEKEFLCKIMRKDQTRFHAFIDFTGEKWDYSDEDSKIIAWMEIPLSPEEINIAITLKPGTEEGYELSRAVLKTIADSSPLLKYDYSTHSLITVSRAILKENQIVELK